MTIPESESRSRFEKWVQSMEYEVLRYSNDETKHAWPGQYRDIKVQLAWEAWLESSKQLPATR